jgi:hypothetical protein
MLVSRSDPSSSGCCRVRRPRTNRSVTIRADPPQQTRARSGIPGRTTTKGLGEPSSPRTQANFKRQYSRGQTPPAAFSAPNRLHVVSRVVARDAHRGSAVVHSVSDGTEIWLNSPPSASAYCRGDRPRSTCLSVELSVLTTTTPDAGQNAQCKHPTATSSSPRGSRSQPAARAGPRGAVIGLRRTQTSPRTCPRRDGGIGVTT